MRILLPKPKSHYSGKEKPKFLFSKAFTDEFLAPFYDMADLELDESGTSIPWMLDGCLKQEEMYRMYKKIL